MCYIIKNTLNVVFEQCKVLENICYFMSILSKQKIKVGGFITIIHILLDIIFPQKTTQIKQD